MKTTLFRRLLTALCLLTLTTGTLLTAVPARHAMAASNYLHTSGNKIYDSSNRLVNLSGVNWFGFETSNGVPHGLWTRSWGSMLDQIKSLGYNVIRLPFSNAVLHTSALPTGIDFTKNPDLKGLSSLQIMDKLIAGAGQRGLKIILDDHRSTAGGGPESNGLWYTSDYPESTWISDWKMLANRYKASEAVIGADLRNEPHGDACWGCGDNSKDWRLAAERGGNAILGINPSWLIIVEGVGTFNGQSTWWGGNLMGAKQYPVRLSVAGRLIYSPHEYPASVAYQTWFSDPTYPNNLPALWDKYWGYLTKDNIAPIMVGEFGSRLQTTSDQQWFTTFNSYIKANKLGWTFWSWNPDSGDTGGLLNDDWTTVVQIKQDALKPLQYAMIGAASAGSIATPTQTVAPTPTQAIVSSKLLLADFESGNLSGWSAFRDAASTINTSLVSPGGSGTYALRVGYSIASGGYGGVQRAFASPQDWSGFTQFSFKFYGTNTGHTIRVELMDDRASGSTTDTSERFVHSFADNFSGWKTVNIAWSQFTRRADWQPAGAPNNGLTLTQMWGFSFAPLSGAGSFQLDQIQLLTSAVAATPTPTPSTTSVLIDNFEQGAAPDWSLFMDPSSSMSASVVSPGEQGQYALQLDAQIATNGWGGAQKIFASPQDWTAFQSFDFWMYGSNSGAPMRLEILDNRAAGSTTDTSERFVHLFTDNWLGWKHFTLPWSSFVRRTDWQPAGAPNDGFGRAQVWGFNFSVVSGAMRFQLDEIRLIGP